MKSIYYVGTSGLLLGKNPTTIDTLTKILENNYNVRRVGVGRNYERIMSFARFPLKTNLRGSLLIIDVYSTRAFNYFLFAGVIGIFRGMRLLPIIHGGEIENRLKRSGILSSYLFSRSEHIICPSGYMSRLFKDYGYANTRVIPNPLNIDDYTFVSRDPENINILWLRALDIHYNVEMAISVISELKSKCTRGVHLHVVGPDKIGMLQKVRELCVALNVENNVTFYGFCKKSDWIPISEKCSYFINTSKVDNAPVSVKEAMALGLAVISTDVGGLAHMINHGADGILVPSNDSTGMAAEITNLSQSPDKFKTITKTARAKVLLASSIHVNNLWDEIIER